MVQINIGGYGLGT